MSSRKAKRYGQGGSNHKGVKQAGRPNGKAYKKIIRKFDPEKRKLVAV